MKFFKKRLTAIALTAAMTFTPAVGVFAAETNPSSITVELDGKQVSLSDAQAIMKDGRTFLPFNSTFEAMGATITYESSTKTTSAVKGDVTINFVAGSKDVTLIKNGVTSTLTMDAPSFVLEETTYVPARLVAQSFGYNVGWDNDTKTIILLDVDKIIAQYADKFTIMDKYLAFSKASTKDPQSIDGKFDMKIAMGSGAEAIPFSANGTITGTADSSKADIALKMILDIDKLVAVAGSTEELDAESKALLDQIKNIDINVKGDMKAGKFYIQSPLFATSFNVAADSWIEIDLNDLLDQAGMGSSLFTDLVKIADSDSFVTSLGEMLRVFPINSKQEALMLESLLKTMVSTYGDDSFVKSSDKYVSTTTQTDNGTTTKITMTLPINKSGDVTGFSMDMTTSADGIDFMKIAVKQDASNKYTVTMNMTVPELMEMVYKLDMQLSPTSVKPAGAPSDKSKIVIIEDLF